MCGSHHSAQWMIGGSKVCQVPLRRRYHALLECFGLFPPDVPDPAQVRSVYRIRYAMDSMGHEAAYASE